MQRKSDVHIRPCWMARYLNLMIKNEIFRIFSSIFTLIVQLISRLHDTYVFSQSDLNDKLQDWMRTPGRAIRDTYHIIGDSTFLCLKEVNVFKFFSRKITQTLIFSKNNKISLFQM